MIEFRKRVLFLGYGAVAQCALPIFVRYFRVPPQNVTVLDFEDRTEAMAPWTAQGMRFVRKRIAPDNFGAVLGEYLSTGDLLVDLAWNIDGCEIVQWCHDHGVLYLNTSVEIWDPYTGATEKHPTERTLYWRHMNLRRMIAGWSQPGPTAVLEHGANPGLISHWTKQGLLDIAERLLEDKKVEGQEAEEIRQLARDRTFNQLAMRLGVKVIHCSERDTQITDRPKQVGEFVNTWCIEGFREEGITTAEMGWGTHEKQMPPMSYTHAEGPRNQICLARMGMNTWVVSWVPHYCIRGMIIRHGEAFTISDRLTVWEGERAVYRPTVHYAYCPCDAAIVSLEELRGRDYALQSKQRIMRDEIVGGEDILGALLMGHAYQSWWTGSALSIDASRRQVPHQNATTMQVAISVVAASLWMVEHPDRGVCSPEDLPHDYVLNIAKPYLGKSLSLPADWTPLKHYVNHFHGYNQPDLDFDDPWQFKNFLVTDGD
ncbi:MAG: saccharopine dehydrogenase NADP-binding domain-containing protein [Planctomycetaceae bacterium]|nr:saccharopine dehydrogenase NADP-binding domain-containing protein [Planctomycetaceae bacterium]